MLPQFATVNCLENYLTLAKAELCFAPATGAPSSTALAMAPQCN